MKACPICQTQYDDWIEFCFQDGAILQVTSAASGVTGGAPVPSAPSPLAPAATLPSEAAAIHAPAPAPSGEGEPLAIQPNSFLPEAAAAPSDAPADGPVDAPSLGGQGDVAEDDGGTQLIIPPQPEEVEATAPLVTPPPAEPPSSAAPSGHHHAPVARSVPMMPPQADAPAPPALSTPKVRSSLDDDEEPRGGAAGAGLLLVGFAAIGGLAVVVLGLAWWLGFLSPTPVLIKESAGTPGPTGSDAPTEIPGAPGVTPPPEGRTDDPWGKNDGSQKGKLILNTEPSGALVYIDGEPGDGFTPLTMELPYGDHTLRFEKDGFTPEERKINIQNVEQPLLIKLAPLAGGMQSQVSFKAATPGAVLTLDGVEKGPLPQGPVSLSTGGHTAKLSAGGKTCTVDGQLQEAGKACVVTVDFPPNTATESATCSWSVECP